ncbi:hypothetical protein FNV43_RR15006 [Rhamnella rubrinervis]|uniref:Uncharacterized protein n=1 Tax=Rhamnella rubrinervis TaxID=2594499 RepID=A0A8K0E2J3_9ROSA|nr:hypothetical protein FNV43_RR15006 [Rhamnella rubrinervis]
MENSSAENTCIENSSAGTICMANSSTGNLSVGNSNSYTKDTKFILLCNHFFLLSREPLPLHFSLLPTMTTVSDKPRCHRFHLRYTSDTDDDEVDDQDGDVGDEDFFDGEGEDEAAAYYYHGQILNKPNEPSSHVSVMCCFLAVEKLLVESKKACLSFCLVALVTRFGLEQFHI